MEHLAKEYEFESLFDVFLSFYTKEYGELKVKEVRDKVCSSIKISKFLAETRRRQIKPGTNDFLMVVHSSSSFAFSKAEVIALACSSVLFLWYDNIAKQLELAEDYYLNKVFFSILNKCDNYKTHTSGPNFFYRFYEHLNSLA